MATRKAAADDAAQDDTPTPDEAREMFNQRPDLAAVLTTEGRMTRDGVIDRSTVE